jgi:SAM-dependent methyltransferase
VNGRLYDAVVRRSRALEAARAQLLAGAQGRVLEIGAGTGLNARHYPEGVEVTFTEPDPRMARRVHMLQARAEELPFDDGSFDTVVSTLVLCSVDDLERSLREIRRVLAPGGTLLFLEHVRGAEGSRLARWQDRVAPVWRVLADGCRCNRRTLAALEAVFETVEARDAGFRPPLTRPVLCGRAGV